MEPVFCREVSKLYGGVPALDGAGFRIAKGQCFGLLGPNGAGKSTLIRILYGVTPRDGGEVRVFGMDPARNAREIKKRIGVVTQNNALDEDMPVRDNMWMYARCAGVPLRVRGERVDRLLTLMSLSHRAGARIRELSGGMQRRLVFVRALLSEPDLLILDEPTTGLDPAVRLHLWEQIRELKAMGVTILLTTHYMDEAERLCDQLVIIDQGRIRAAGSPRELIDRFCPGTVAVLPLDAKIRERIQPDERESAEGFAWFEDRAGINLRGPSLAAVERFLQARGMAPILLRPANLEDVFLEITGRELGDHA